MKLVNTVKTNFAVLSIIISIIALYGISPVTAAEASGDPAINNADINTRNTPEAYHGIKSTEDINDSYIPAAIRGSLKSIDSENPDLLKKQLLQNKAVRMEEKFNAFAQNLKTNLVLRDVDIASILRIIAKQGGKNIVLDDTVKGVINADLKNISLNEAMQAILTSQELEVRIENNTIFVASRPAMARKGLNRKYIQAFKLNNANAAEVAKLLEASIFNKGYVIDEKSSSSKTDQSAKGQTSQPAGNSPVQAVSNMLPTLPQGTQSASTLPATYNTADARGNTSNPAATGTSTGQSHVIDSKTIKGEVESLDPGANFNDAAKLASEIKIQNRVPSIQDIDVNNNDGGAIVIPDTRTNSILVAGLQQDIQLARETIKYLDKPLPQVAIEVSLIEVSKNDTKNLGLSVSGNVNKFTSGFNSAGLASALGLQTAENETGIMFSTIKDIRNNVGVRLNKLLLTNKSKLLANPTVIALDRSESIIKITDQIVSRMTVTIQQNGGPTLYSPELSDIGIVLNILPRIGNDGYITMRIRPSITSTSGKVELGTSGGINLGFVTPISTREVILQDARIKSGETFAIAGLLKESDFKDIGKLPLVGDMPVFGPLFRNTSIDHKKSELIILITPKIIDDIAYN